MKTDIRRYLATDVATRRLKLDTETGTALSSVQKDKQQDPFRKIWQTKSVHYFPKEASSKGLIKVFGDIFITFGVPQEVTMDGGPQFISNDLVSFLDKWGVKHRKSAPYNPHANLRAETAVKSAKRILTSKKKSDGSPN